VTEGLFVVSLSLSEVLLLLPPHPPELEPHDGFLFSVHLAYKVISHVFHIRISVILSTNPVSEYHPSKLYQDFVASSNAIYVSTVYSHILSSLFIHPSSSYVIVYSIISRFASYVLFHLLHAGIVTVQVIQSISVPLHHKNLYPSLVGSTRVIAPLSIVYVVADGV
jgi:hypothetical protein